MSKLELNYKEIRLIQAGLDARDAPNIKLINSKRIDGIGKLPEDYIDGVIEERKDILNLKKKLDVYSHSISNDKSTKKSLDNALSIDIDMNIDDAMKKLEEMKALMLEIDNIDISKNINKIHEEVIKRKEEAEPTHKLITKKEYMKKHLDISEQELKRKWDALAKDNNHIVFITNADKTTEYKSLDNFCLKINTKSNLSVDGPKKLDNTIMFDEVSLIKALDKIMKLNKING